MLTKVLKDFQFINVIERKEIALISQSFCTEQMIQL